jgi:hypothetical protein
VIVIAKPFRQKQGTESSWVRHVQILLAPGEDRVPLKLAVTTAMNRTPATSHGLDLMFTVSLGGRLHLFSFTSEETEAVEVGHIVMAGR